MSFIDIVNYLILRSEQKSFRLPININAGRSTLESSLCELLLQRWGLGMGQWDCFWGWVWGKNRRHG